MWVDLARATPQTARCTTIPAPKRAVPSVGRGGERPPNRMRVFVRNLRGKLGEDAESPAWIFNERGVGCRMPEPAGRKPRRAGGGEIAGADDGFHNPPRLHPGPKAPSSI